MNEGNVLVTGGSGYIAAFCIRQLLEEGYDVRTTVRSLSRAPEVRGQLRKVVGEAADSETRLRFFAADLTQDEGWAAAMDGVAYVLHVASPVPAAMPKNDEDLVKPAREGTLRVLRAARDAGVKRVVVTSSTAAVCYGYGSRETPYTEVEWSNAENRDDSSAYERSKTLAERAAWDFMAKEGGALEMTTVNPGAVIGPVLGNDFSTSIEIVKKLLDGSLPGCPPIGWPLVDVRDIADLHVRAMTAPGAAGERYLGAGDFLWMSELAGVLRERVPSMAKRIPKRKIPAFVVRMVALFDPVLRGRLFELGKERRVDASKARTTLGWTQRPVAESLQDCAESLVREGIVAHA